MRLSILSEAASDIEHPKQASTRSVGLSTISTFLPWKLEVLNGRRHSSLFQERDCHIADFRCMFHPMKREPSSDVIAVRVEHRDSGEYELQGYTEVGAVLRCLVAGCRATYRILMQPNSKTSMCAAHVYFEDAITKTHPLHHPKVMFED
jgi:hypothetical protein